jgi:hypothetical protein
MSPLVGVCLLALLAAGCRLISAPQAQTVNWLVYGDSLSEQAAPYLSPHGSVGSRFYGGTAPCNWVPGLNSDTGAFTPNKVLLQFIGNLPACMNGRNPQQGYEQDLTKIVNFWKDKDVPIVMILSPPSETNEFAWARQAELNVANRLNVPVGDAGQSVLSAGQFTFFLPCQSSETAAEGCGADGQIRVRNPDGVHFGQSSPTYSSGAERFAAAELQN